ncbi:hypothetical protein FB567DRAFT_264387 [Paraphoma chrysanthemicola]|uniref:Uncharacterized protein n=1 Tax=Paraphoma chrysanthemicola TaxID=798071 RepID=A0A8K0RBN8_9PLEO|nr:hypothetical protein FB567DRAFT_264387 [Paraphoma chrysanthemicola]
MSDDQNPPLHSILPSSDENNAGHGADNPNQKPLLRASTTFYERAITDWWWWELLSWLFSFCSVAAILGVLLVYDGKEQPEQIVIGITLNTYIAVFAAISKAALILPVSESIGQLKWLWFGQDVPLWDFHLFDAASRGPWGSFMLLLRTRMRHLVSLGALVTVLALAFEPFFQQIVTYPERLAQAGSGMAFAATTYIPDRPFLTRGQSKSNSPMGMAVDIAFNMPNDTRGPPPSTCPTGTCTWPTYSTLGVCHECQDVSFNLEYFCYNTSATSNKMVQNLTRPQGGVLVNNPCGYIFKNWFLIGTDFSTFRNLTITSLSAIAVSTFDSRDFRPYANSTSYENATLPVANFYVAYTPGGPAAAMRNDTPILLECLLSWCAKTIEMKSTNGTISEKVVESTIITTNTSDKFGYAPVTATFGSNTTFKIDNGSTQVLRDRILSNLPLYLYQDPQYEFGPTPGLWNFHQVAPYDFNPYLSLVTNAITHNLQSRSSNTVPVEGIAWRSERFVRVQWAWITLPAVSLAGSLILICATILKSRRNHAPVWKSSSLATLLHGLSEETRALVDSKSTLSQAEAVSAKLQVRLSPRGEHARLIATDSCISTSNSVP